MKIVNVETTLISLPFDSGGAAGWESASWTTLDRASMAMPSSRATGNSRCPMALAGGWIRMQM